MDKDLISVIIPVYNVEKYLMRCVDSVINQTYKNLEIILVNDGSTDSSGILCDELAKNDDRIKVIHKENGGLSDARNTGEQESKGDYIIYIDSDDYVHVDMISSLYEQIRYENADVSICGVMNVYVNSQNPQCNDTEQYFVCEKKEFLKEYLIGERIPGSICNKLLKRSVANRLKFPVGKIYEDAFYHYDLISIAEKFVVNTKPYYYYYHRDGSITTKSFKNKDLAYIDIYNKYYELILKKYGDLEEEGFFRMAYSYFFILDKMLLEEGYNKLEEYDNVVKFLKRNAVKIFRNDIFRKGRRIAALALLIDVRLYRKLLLKNIEQSRKVHD